MNKPLVALLGILAVGLIAVSQAFFIVDQREQAIVLQLGQPKGELRKPGIHIKIPIMQEVRFFDSRILSVDPKPEQVVISSSFIDKQKSDEINKKAQSKTDQEQATTVIEDISGEPIIVDTFARYKIIDPLQFMKTLRTIGGANLRLSTILNDATRAVLGQTTLKELLSKERDSVMIEIRGRVNNAIIKDKLGIKIIDVRIVRADLTADLRTSTVRRMISELKERATKTRANGEQQALEIRSKAEKERTIIIAEAQRDSEIRRGKGDEESIKIYAKAFNKDKEFYSFIRSMEAYKNALANHETRLILSPDSKFFRYFKD